jgi:hypothetical protein
MLSRIRVAIVVVLVAGLVVSGFVGYRLFTEEPDRDPPVSHVTGYTEDRWQLVSYRGVTVEVPPEWARLDTAICDVELERWAAAGQEQCEGDTGLSFLDSHTFDSSAGPGVRAAPASDTLPAGGWTGYVTRGDMVINVTEADEAVVRRILQSASAII